ncbi:hypothetical protein VTO73DRAFT_10277 [Trametes versicolor]
MAPTDNPWQLPTGAMGMLPSKPLENEDGYSAWSKGMQAAFDYAGLWELVCNTSSKPEETDATFPSWKRQNAAASSMIIRALDPAIISSIDMSKTAAEQWSALEKQYSRTTISSAVNWFRSLVTPLPSIHSVDTHVRAFQDAVTHLKAAGFPLSEPISAGIFLSTLADAPGEPSQWSAYTAKFTLDKETTLNSVLADVFNERRRVLGNSPSVPQDTAMSVETALAALERDAYQRGRKWCRHCRLDGHSYDECRTRLRSGAPNTKKGRFRKGKDKAHVAKDSSSASEESGDENSHFVRSERILYTSVGNYLPRVPCSTSPSATDSAFTTRSHRQTTRTIVIDSGTSSHVHSMRPDFTAIRASSSLIRGFGNGKTAVAGRGEAQLIARLPNDDCTRLRLQDTCYAPNTSPSLISVSRLDDAKCYTLFGEGRCVTFERDDNGLLLRTALDGGKVVLTGTQGPDRLYHLDVPSQDTAYALAPSVTDTKWLLLHGRMGHLNFQSIHSMVRKGLIRGVKFSTAELAAPFPHCPACTKGKMTRASFPSSTIDRPLRILLVVSTDLWGNAQVQTPSGKWYVMTFTDHWSRWLWVAFLRRKSDAFDAFKTWLARVERETGEQLVTLRADNGGEYVNKQFADFCSGRGIHLETTSPRTPEQNGIAERQNLSVFNRVRTVLIDSHLPLNLWGEAVNYIVYTKNRNPTAALGGRTPYQVRFGHAPNISFLHRFGCRAFVYNDHPSRKKLDPRVHEGIFVGYSDTQKAYRVYFPSTRKLVTSIHVKFNDDVDGCVGALPEGEHNYGALFPSEDEASAPSSGEEPPADPPHPDRPISPRPVSPPAPAPRPRGRPKGSKNRRGGEPTRHSKRIQNLVDAPAIPVADAAPQDVQGDAPAGPGGDVAHAGPWGEIPQAADLLDDDSDLPELTDSSEEEVEHSLLLDHSFVVAGDEPKTYEEAMASPYASDWEDAMQKELESIATLGSFELTELPADRKPIGSRWVFLIKRDTDGRIIRFKARLVAQGFTQRPGVDFKETFAPVARPESIRAIAALAAQRDYAIHVVDVDSAFLNSEIPDGQEAYIKQPPGFVLVGQEGLVWRLRKALYGLRQSGYLWYQKLKSIMLDLGFRVCRSDPCVFFRYLDKNGITIVTSHVDDLALFCPSDASAIALKSEISSHVPIKDGGEISLLLGVKVTRDRPSRTISFSHTHKIDAALEEFGFSSLKPVSTPMDASERLTSDQAPKTPDDIEYMRRRRTVFPSAVGTLMHIATHTRPDIAKAVQSVARFMANPGKPHWRAMKRIFQYLNATRHYALTVGGDGPTEPLAYCDADWGNDPETARSTSGYCVLIGAGCTSWSAKKQTTVAASTPEAEYYAAVHCGREVLWLRQLLSELGFLSIRKPPSTTLRVDNTGAIKMILTPDKVSPRTKHINIAYHWIRDAARAKHIVPVYVRSDKNIADIFTKPLGPTAHSRCTRMLGLGPAPSSTR